MAPVTSSEGGFGFKSAFGGLSTSLAGMLPVDTPGDSVRPGSFGEAPFNGASDDAALAGGPDGTVPEEFSEAVTPLGRTPGGSVRPGSFGEAPFDGVSDDAALVGGPDETALEESSEAVGPLGRTPGGSVRPGSFGEAPFDGVSDDAALVGGPDRTVP
jgi:hypothetical protein